MKKHLNLILCTLCILLCACHQQGGTVKTFGNYKISATIDTLLPSCVDTFRYLPLRGSDKHPVRQITKLETTANKLFLFDKKSHRIIAYDTKGNFLYELDKRGKGKGEYLEIANFTATERYLYTLDNYRHKMNVYDATNARFVKEIALPYSVWDVEAFSDNDFLFTFLNTNKHASSNYSQPLYAVWRTDSLMNVTGEYIPYEKDYAEMIGKPYYFMKSGDKIAFHLFRDNGYYVFSKQGEPHFVAVTSADPIPDTNKCEYQDALDHGYTFLTMPPIQVGGSILAQISHDGYEETVMLSKDKPSACNPEYNSRNNIIGCCGIYKGEVIGSITDFSFYQDLVSSGLQAADSHAEQLLKSGGTCLLFYKMKANR